MLKVLSVVDKEGTALDRLAKGVAPYHTNIDYNVVDVHPKRPDESQLARFEQLAHEADIIDFLYFRTAVMLLERFPWLHEKKLMLSHFNPYSYKEDTWDWAQINVAGNREIEEGLKAQGSQNVTHVPITTDPLFWQYKRELKPNKNVIMVANRIESKKGILPVAIACADAGLHFILVGAVSDRNYLYDIMQTGVLEFHEQITDEELRDLYAKSTIHVCNSIDNFESGTMPILEAMQSGVPVLTRRIGHVPELDNGDNLTIYDGDPEDNLAIQEHLENMLADTKALEAQRDAAWNTARNYNFERRAFEYQKLYRQLMSDDTPVSVVVPIYDNPDTIRACLTAVANQDYSNIELIVCDDNGSDPEGDNLRLISEFSKTVSFPVRYIEALHQDSRGLASEHGDYGLARARNMGIIEATGEIIVFCDQRMIMEADCVSKLVENVVPRVWVYGNKNGKKSFVENLSAISKEDIVRAGMFCERMDEWGGMSQEVRSRTRMQGIKHVFIEDARATAKGKSSNKHTKRDGVVRMKNRLAKIGL